MEVVTPVRVGTLVRNDSLAQAGDNLTHLRRLIWLYFWLLILEGALRKWIFPQLAGPLLLVRDPVLLLCYLEAVRQRQFPANGYVAWLAGIAAASTLVSLVQIGLGMIPSTLVITAFGIRANFLHLPLIFLIAQTFTRRDIEAVGKGLLLVAPLMAVLVLLQFRAAPDAWINTGAGIGSGQITVAVGGMAKIRPSGLFSYSTGLASYMALLAAFVMHDFMSGRVFPRVLGIAGAASLIVMAPLAVSRSSAIGVMIVIMAAVICGLLKPVLLPRALMIGAVGGGAAVVYAMVTVLRQGVTILTMRFDQAGGLWVGIGERFVDGLMGALEVATAIPFLGSGVGMGTNAAAGLLTGQRAFLLAEGEWMRVMLEMGPILGLAYLGLRLALTLQLGTAALAKLQTLDTLPLLLFSATAPLLFNGQFGQPTALGFGVLGAGICLGAARLRAEGGPARVVDSTAGPIPPRGRSIYAERLHADRESAHE